MARGRAGRCCWPTETRPCEPSSPAGEAGDETLYRRDPVRSLAESDAASPALPEARAAVAAGEAAPGSVDVAAPPQLPSP